MSLITDPLYLIHTSRIKFLRIEERGERIISFPPTVMSDDYVRLAAPIYPEMQYCYSPVYDGISNNNNNRISCSPRTTKRNYRQRLPTTLKTNFSARYPNMNTNVETRKESPDSEDEDIVASNSSSKQETIKMSAIAVTASRSFHTTSLHPSVDSVIDPSPRSSIDTQTSFPPPPVSLDSASLEPLAYTKTQPSRPPPMTSALSALIAEKATKAENPFAEYSFVSGKGESKSIKLCVYFPHSTEPYKPCYIIVRPDAVTDDVIGYILYDYVEEKRQPELEEDAYDLAEWVLLIAEDDGEIEEGLPAIDRTQNIRRVSFEQFALCRATKTQAAQNDLDRARMGRSKPDGETLRKKKEASSVHVEQAPATVDEVLETGEDEVTSASFTTHLITQQQQPDASTVAVPIPSSKATLTKATMPMTPLKYFRIKLMTNEEVSATTAIPVYAEMFIGDVLELVSRKRKLDPNEYMLTIADTKVIVPNDTTVESMKGINDLTLTKKGTALTIPSTSHTWRSPIKRKKDEVNHPMYFSTSESPLAISTATANEGLLSQYKKYTVSRKMPMFVSKRVYILAIDGDYIHLMPPEHKGMFDSVKTTSFHASAVRSCKQSKKAPTNFKVMILKERDFKTYDLEAENAKEANEICSRIRFLMQVTKGA
ncbi:hypothetical protein INT47_004795 [Mucor saturninus]|uniref:Stress-activated map kinase-interacting protein 1 n=1 Tax=Mucor saturninus TaxID=64648 RepID=A0A8H7R411_9FUNG|nr:hypothetical protein INT47_004795 [Mucor saturninus]